MWKGWSGGFRGGVVPRPAVEVREGRPVGKVPPPWVVRLGSL